MMAQTQTNAQATPGKFKNVFSRGNFGNHGNQGAFMREWKAACRATQRGKYPIVRRECRDCRGTHKNIYFVRKTNPIAFNLW